MRIKYIDMDVEWRFTWLYIFLISYNVIWESELPRDSIRSIVVATLTAMVDC
jgi:hypothetical protein